MTNKRKIFIAVTILKLLFLSGSWSVYIILRTIDFDSDGFVRVIWQDINEFAFYILIITLIIEIAIRKTKPVILTMFCIITAYILTQAITADGTRLDIWINGY